MSRCFLDDSTTSAAACMEQSERRHLKWREIRLVPETSPLDIPNLLVIPHRPTPPAPFYCACAWANQQRQRHSAKISSRKEPCGDAGMRAQLGS
eukprot:1910851-Pleurochrysis_carterae.AAC.1